jgi:hypothetical protein
VAQYDALIIQPHIQAAVLDSDENQPARVWREGRAKVAGAVQGKGMHLYWWDQIGKRVELQLMKSIEIASPLTASLG